MEMLLKSSTMVLVRVADEQGVHIEPPFGITTEALTKRTGNIGRVVIGIVRIGTNVEVYQYPVAGFSLNERHIAIPDRKK